MQAFCEKMPSQNVQKEKYFLLQMDIEKIFLFEYHNHGGTGESGPSSPDTNSNLKKHVFLTAFDCEVRIRRKCYEYRTVSGKSSG